MLKFVVAVSSLRQYREPLLVLSGAGSTGVQKYTMGANREKVIKTWFTVCYCCWPARREIAVTVRDRDTFLFSP